MNITTGMRLDQELVVRGLVESRAKARRSIESKKVVVNGQVEAKPARLVHEIDEIEITEQDKFVSRSGEKLDGVLRAYPLEIRGKICLDVGASTGGFTDCLLQRGAKKIYAIDVGHGQLNGKLANDERVISMEGINARYLEIETFSDAFEVIAIDVSFISLKLILPAVLNLAAEKADLIALIKPQFEVGKDKVGSGGIVREETHRIAAVESIKDNMNSFAGWQVKATMEATVTGSDGNQEYLLWAKK
ncbi:MAG: TlyA family RNA methyltransferase [Verrucomicrobiota bacterium]